MEFQYPHLQTAHHLHMGTVPEILLCMDLCLLVLYQAPGTAQSQLFSYALYQILPDNHGTCHAVQKCRHPLHTGKKPF